MDIRIVSGQAAGSAQFSRGSTLIIAIVLLLVLSLATVFALQVGVSEQRTSGNDLRARIVNEVAAAGIGHGTETFRANNAWLFSNTGQSPDPALWELCDVDDDTFPCGAIPAADRKGQYRFIGGVAGGPFGKLGVPLTPIAGVAALAGSRQGFTEISDFPVEYAVGAVVCTLTVPPDSVCTTNPNLRSGVGVITLVSRASMTGESAVATHTKGVGVYRIINIPPNTPPIVAGGLLDGLGNATIVSNPNAAGGGAGSGVPLSIWSRYGIDGSGGSWQTCQTEEFFRSGSPKVQGTETQIVTCEDCSCPADKKTSGGHNGPQSDGKGGTYTRGFDILDPRAPTDVDATGILASEYFPCDTFEYVFGERARSKVVTSADVPYSVCTGDSSLDDKDGDLRTDGPDAFLSANFTQVKDCDASLKAEIVKQGGGGFYWHRSDVGTGCTLKGTIGSADLPIVLVTEVEVDLDTSTEFFGLIFARDTRVDLPTTRAGIAAYGGPGIKPGGGGGAMVYGALIIDGGGKANAGITVVGNNAILEALGEDDRNRKVGGPLARSWTDSVSY